MNQSSWRWVLVILILSMVLPVSAFAVASCPTGPDDYCDCGEVLEGDPGDVYTLSGEDSVTGLCLNSDGLAIFSPGVTLDCNGQSMIGYPSNFMDPPTKGIFIVAADVTVRNCEILDYDIPILVQSSSNVEIHNNEFYGTLGSSNVPRPLYAIQLVGTRDSNVHDNEIHDVQTGIYSTKGDQYIYDFNWGNQIHHNQLSLIESAGISMKDGSQLSVHHNSVSLVGFSQSSSHGMIIKNVVESTIEDNDIVFGQHVGAFFQGNNVGTIFRRNLLENNNIGILFDNASVSQSWYDPSAQLLVEQNTITESKLYGVDFKRDNSRVNFTHNTLSKNKHGLHSDFGTGFSATHNMIKDNRQYGAWFSGYSVGAVFNDNTVEGSQTGLFIDWTTQNGQFSHNAICGNVQYDIQNSSPAVQGDHNRCTTTQGWTDPSAPQGWACEQLCGSHSRRLLTEKDCQKLLRVAPGTIEVPRECAMYESTAHAQLWSPKPLTTSSVTSSDLPRTSNSQSIAPRSARAVKSSSKLVIAPRSALKQATPSKHSVVTPVVAKQVSANSITPNRAVANRAVSKSASVNSITPNRAVANRAVSKSTSVNSKSNRVSSVRRVIRR